MSLLSAYFSKLMTNFPLVFFLDTLATLSGPPEACCWLGCFTFIIPSTQKVLVQIIRQLAPSEMATL